MGPTASFATSGGGFCILWLAIGGADLRSGLLEYTHIRMYVWKLGRL